MNSLFPLRAIIHIYQQISEREPLTVIVSRNSYEDVGYSGGFKFSLGALFLLLELFKHVYVLFLQ